ncbi:hypothetical protein P9112_012446 [Eukaryota sp. TZLM1-RC]
MDYPCDDKSLISALCSTISNVPLNLAEWNYQKFVDLVSPPILAATDLIARHSVILKPIGCVLTEVFSVLTQVKFNHSQSAVLAARLLRLTKATFSPLENLPDLSNSASIRDTINSFVVLTNKITTCLKQYNDSKWYKKVFSRDRFKREFEENNKLLNDFSSELNLEFSGIALEKLSALSPTSVEGIISHDEEAFKSALADYNQSILDKMSDQHSDLVKQMQATLQTTLREELKAQMMSCLKNKAEKEREIIQFQSCEENLEIDIKSDEIEVDWKTKIQSGQADIVFGEYGLANVAVKFYTDDECIPADLAREYRILKSLPCVPSVPRVYGISQVYEEGKPRIGLVMEKLSSFTLREAVGKIKTEIRKLDILISLAKTLATCHECHFLHRDLKPDNILFRDRVPVLIDWGSGKNTGSSNMSLSLTDIRAITPSWTSPEQASGERIYSDRIDVFSFGLIMLFVFTGQSIWQGIVDGNHKKQIIIEKLTSGNIPSIPLYPDLPLSLYPLLSQCLKFDFTQRPSMSEVWTVLTAYKKKSCVVECLTLENMPLCHYALAMIDSEYITNAEAEVRKVLYQNLLNLLLHCYSKELGTMYSAIMDLIEHTDNLPHDFIQKRREYEAIWKQRIDAFEKITICNDNVTDTQQPLLHLDETILKKQEDNEQTRQQSNSEKIPDCYDNVNSLLNAPSLSSLKKNSLDAETSFEKKDHNELQRQSTDRNKILSKINSVVDWDSLEEAVKNTVEDLLAGSISSVNLAANNIGKNGAFALACALESNQTLSILYLRNNHIGKEGACALARALEVNQTLSSLNLAANNICKEGACALARALEVNQTLSSLNLAANNICKEGACALARALEVNQTLSILDLRSNNIGKEGACGLARALESNAALSSLNLVDNNIGIMAKFKLKKVVRNRSSLQFFS